MCYPALVQQPSDPSHDASKQPRLSVVLPARNEADNLPPLMNEIVEVLYTIGDSWEVVIVDDASTDHTKAVLTDLVELHPRLRALHVPPKRTNRGHGQSAAFRAGIAASRGDLIIMMDADGQNDPADIPRLLACYKARAGPVMIQGDRTRSRCDSWLRRMSSGVGWLTRRLMLGDTTRDTGCSLRLMPRELALALPLEYTGMHRFIPITAEQFGWSVVIEHVHHRPRMAGRTHYGISNRAWAGFVDCLAVRWMVRRRCLVEPTALELKHGAGVEQSPRNKVVKQKAAV